MSKPTTTSSFSALLNQPLGAVPLVFLDLETTGLHPHQGDRICEVALQRVIGGTLDANLDSLINPQRSLSPRAFDVNGISAEQLAGAPLFADIADALLAPLAGAVLVAHHASFDLEFLHAELARLGRGLPAMPAIDTLALARRLMPQRRSHSLAALTLALNGAPPAHRAMADVQALRLVFADLTERLAVRGIMTLGDTLRYIRGFRPGDVEPQPSPPIAEALRDGRLLRIVYNSVSSPQPTERVIRPLEIVCERGVLYLRAFCYLRDDVRAFVIDKILQIEVKS